MTAAELVARVRTYDWKEAFIRVALLAGLVANSPDGSFSEDVRRRTVDQIPLIDVNYFCRPHCRV